MLRLLRRLLATGDGHSPARPIRGSVTADVLAKRPRARPASPAMPPAQEFDPYNTGVFDRSASWERVGKRGD
jgi:hypothetical protein